MDRSCIDYYKWSNKWRIISSSNNFWIFAVYFFGGVLELIIALKNRQLIAGAYSIPGAVLVVGSLSNLSLSEASGAYLAAGASSLFKELLGR
ncbi:benzoate/H(+) symporter BenE family transporter [Priestia megaterium]|uniref:benzoate/H(+) symporter BenE family transporter n=1 Tax=Priestia megaterium TaxID=1404 RepID=UPI001E5ABD7D|nr:benzoate/H(+) symporter BenE family transporter [Priestia megaterium]